MTTASDGDEAAGGEITNPRNWDIVAEDLFALNIRAIRAMWASITSPASLFEAARDRYWLNRYTPSLRLYFSLVALVAGLQFFWLGEGSPVAESVRNMVALNPDEWGGRDQDAATRDLLSAFIIALPFGYALAHLPAGLLIHIWGKGTRAVERLRLYFCTLVPAAILGIALTPLQAEASPETMAMMQAPTFILFFLVYAATYFFGTARRMPASARIWRAGLMGALVSIIDFVAVFIAFTGAQAFVMAPPLV